MEGWIGPQLVGESVSIAQLCLTLCDPMDCSPPYSSVHGIVQATKQSSRSLLQGVFLTQGLNLGFLQCRQGLYHLSHQGIPTVGP